MRSVSDSTYQKIENNSCKYLPRVDITLKSGMVLDSVPLWDSPTYTHSISSEDFEVGSAKIGTLSFGIMNFTGSYSGYDFEGATVSYRVMCENEYVNICKAVVVETPENESTIINLDCYDFMVYLDKDYEAPTTKKLTAKAYVEHCLSKCGFTHTVPYFNNQTMMLDAIETSEGLTYRQVLAWIGQVTCNNVLANADGNVVLKWYDSAENVHSLTAQKTISVSKNDVKITGVKATEYNKSFIDADGNEIDQKSKLVGNEGYVIEISNNPLVDSSNMETIATNVFNQVKNMTIRKFESAIFSNPLYECGDVVSFITNSGNTYTSVISDITFTVNNSQIVSCKAKSNVKNSTVVYSEIERTTAEIKKQVASVIQQVQNVNNEMTKLISQGYGMNYGKITLPNGNQVDAMFDGTSASDSHYICYWTSNGILASVDGGTTWAIDKNGNALMNVLTVNKLTAEQIDVNNLFAQNITATGTINGAKLVGSNIEGGTAHLGFLRFGGDSIYSDNKKWYWNKDWFHVSVDDDTYIQMDADSGEDLGGLYLNSSSVAGIFAKQVTIDAETVQMPEEVQLGNGLAVSDEKLQVGRIDSITVYAQSYDEVEIQFDTPYKTTPVIVASLLVNPSATQYQYGSVSCAVCSRSKNGFTVRVFNNSNTTRSPYIMWIAFGK